AYINAIGVPQVLVFYGPDVKALTLLVEKNDTSDILKTKFEDWEISFSLYSNTFPDIPLSTLRLLDESSMTGVDYQVETEFRFHAGPTYAIVGFRKFSGENPATEDDFY
ncbi:hypothetical protein LOAG_11697, partial [Loa loa]